MGIPGVLLPYRHLLAVKPREVSLAVPGLKAPVTIRLKTSDVATFRQVFVDKGYDFDLTSQPKIILDAGANIGLASILLANKFPAATIIAIEPEKSNFSILKKNVAPYGDRIIAIHAALWNENASIKLVDPGLGKWGFQTYGGNDGGAPILHEVQAFTVDRIMQDHNVDTIDIAKIDIEGAEKEVFSDATKWIGHINMLIVELHDHQKIGCNRSFYNATGGFELEWHHGENVCLVRHASYLSDAYRRRAMNGTIS